MQAVVRGARLRAARRRDRLPRRAVGASATSPGSGEIARGRAGGGRHLAARQGLALLRRHDAHVRRRRRRAAGRSWPSTGGSTRDSLERVYADAAGRASNGRKLFERSCEPYIEAGQPTQLTKEPGELLEDGYFHGLGHGVGLEVHERPYMGRLGDDLVAGDVVDGRAGLLPARLRRLPAGGPRGRHRGRLRGPDRFPVRPVKYPEAT